MSLMWITGRMAVYSLNLHKLYPINLLAARIYIGYIAMNLIVVVHTHEKVSL
jgi:hypothetical protein